MITPEELAELKVTAAELIKIGCAPKLLPKLIEAAEALHVMVAEPENQGPACKCCESTVLIGYNEDLCLECREHTGALKSKLAVAERALEVIASNGEGRGMGWTPAQHARQALAEIRGTQGGGA